MKSPMKSTTRVVVVAVLLVAFVGLAGAADDPEARPGIHDSGRTPVIPSQFSVIAHRGFSSVAPENTLAAFRRGVELGVDATEFDVRRTRDGQLVVFHDDDLARTTNFASVFPQRRAEDASIRQLTYAELERLDAGSWKAPEYRGEKIPTLRATLTALRGRCVPVIEIKEEDIGGDVGLEVQELGMADEVLTISFHPRAVREFRDVLPGATTGLNIHERGPEDPRERARQHARAARDVGANALIVNYRTAELEYVQELRHRAFSVWVYTVNDMIVAGELAAMGLDGLISDVPDLVLATRASALQNFQARPGFEGRTVTLTAGAVPIRDLARFLSDSAGLPLLYDSRASWPAGEQVIVTSDITDADYAVVKAILNANNILLEERALPHGQRVLVLDPHTVDASGSGPVARPVLLVDRDRDVERVETTYESSAAEPQSRRHAGLLLTAVPERVRSQTDLASGWGVFVEEVDPKVAGKPPELEPLERYDIVISVNRDRIRDPQSLLETLTALEPGAIVQYHILRRGRTKIVSARRE